jgi:hypothetical protein
MMDFNFFYFKQWTESHVRNVIGEISADDLKIVTKHWTHWWVWQAQSFYHDQISQHRYQMLNAFMRQHKLQHDYQVLENEHYDTLYTEFKAHDENYQRHESTYADWSQWGDDLPNIEFTSGSEWISEPAKRGIERLENVMEKRFDMRYDYLPKLIPAWFDAQIDNSLEQQKELRAMDYQVYLKTRHWHKVRALTIFTYGANCVGKPCEWNWGEGMWFAYANHRHVHHISYKNRGNERFGDVCVLCDKCHAALHSKKEIVLDENSIPDFLARQWTHA